MSSARRWQYMFQASSILSRLGEVMVIQTLPHFKKWKENLIVYLSFCLISHAHARTHTHTHTQFCFCFKCMHACVCIPSRNNMPDVERLRGKLRRSRGRRAYACQCSWFSARDLADLSQQPQLRWVCGKHPA